MLQMSSEAGDVNTIIGQGFGETGSLNVTLFVPFTTSPTAFVYSLSPSLSLSISLSLTLALTHTHERAHTYAHSGYRGVNQVM